MDEKRRSTVQAKLEILLSHVEDLKSFLPPMPSSYLKDRKTRSAVERESQVIVECAMDINVLILQHEERSTPGTGREGFERMLSLGLVTPHTRSRFAETYIGFRNLLVHVYDKINPTAAYHTSKRLIADTTQYAREIRQYLDSLEGAEDSPPTIEGSGRSRLIPKP